MRKLKWRLRSRFELRNQTRWSKRARAKMKIKEFKVNLKIMMTQSMVNPSSHSQILINHPNKDQMLNASPTIHNRTREGEIRKRKIKRARLRTYFLVSSIN